MHLVGCTIRIYYDTRTYESPIDRVIKSRKIKGVGHAACMGEKINAYKVLVRKHAGKRLLGRYRRRL